LLLALRIIAVCPAPAAAILFRGAETSGLLMVVCPDLTNRRAEVIALTYMLFAHQRMASFYVSRDQHGRKDVLLHAFWVQKVACSCCGHAYHAHPNRLAV
jgi:hypothetical protein